MEPRRVSNIEPFTNKYNWDGIKKSSKIEVWKKYKSNSPTVVFKVLMKKKWKYAQLLSKYN